MSEERKDPELAVALRYKGSGAPQVVAKGKGLVAEQIINKAKEHKVPLKNDSGLAKLLSGVPLGDEIPRELYIAVAEVLAFAYMLSEKTIPAPQPPIIEPPPPAPESEPVETD